MSEEILVNVTPRETRIAILENGVLQEILIERFRKHGLVGNIYLGRVVRVLPGMQAAFVDIGIERAAFLHSSDIVTANGAEQPRSRHGVIEDLVHESQEIVVQVVKDPLGAKGARLTTQLCVASRYMVIMPNNPFVGISQRIENDAERERLRDAILMRNPELRPAVSEGEEQGEHPPRTDGGASGFIVRTAAEGVAVEDLHRDLEFLQRLWQSIGERRYRDRAPAVIHEDLPLVLRTLRDLVDGDSYKIRIDCLETTERAVEFAQQFMPGVTERIEYYSGDRPIMDIYLVEDEIERALQRKVELKSGGHLVIDQTEAMTTIDVNTGGYVGHRNLEETIFKTNLEAAQAIARQLRLRNLGGIIIVDFIDMSDHEHQRLVLRALEKGLERDHAKIAISEITSLGLVQITRKRTRESLEHILCETCPTCRGRSSVKSVETVCYEILREILREARQFDANKLVVVASQAVVDRLNGEAASSIAELQVTTGRPISLQVETNYHQEQYDVVLL